MRIYCISNEELQVDINLLNWLTGLSINRGKNEERYWIVKTDTEFYNPSNDVNIGKLGRILLNFKTNDYSSLMIMKNEERRDRETPNDSTAENKEQPGDFEDNQKGDKSESVVEIQSDTP